jgi:hypothetical protein
MNICQIASQDLIACLQWVHQGIALSRVPFFQQVLAIASESHIIGASDYAIEQYQTIALASSDLPAIETLIQHLEVWSTTAADRAEAQRASQHQAVSFADALDEIIYETLCPDWILVEAEGRSLPNAVSIHSFMQEWRSIRDDLPPDGGMSLWPAGPKGPDTPDSGEPHPEKLAKQQFRQGTAANGSVVFSQQACISMALGLTNISGQSLIGATGNAPIATNFQEQITEALGGNLSVSIAWVQSGAGHRLQLEVGGKTITTDIAWEDITRSDRLNNTIAMVNSQVQQNPKDILNNVKLIAENSDRSTFSTTSTATGTTPITTGSKTIDKTTSEPTANDSETILIASAEIPPAPTPSEPAQTTPQPVQEEPTISTLPNTPIETPQPTPTIVFSDEPPTIIKTKVLPIDNGLPKDDGVTYLGLKEAIATGDNQALVTVFFTTSAPPITPATIPNIQTIIDRLQGTPDADDFFLQSGSIQLITYQSHDRFGLIGGLSYSDLAITPTTVQSMNDSFSGYQITIKATGEQLAIVIPAAEAPATLPLSADAFFTEASPITTDEISAGPTMALEPNLELVQHNSNSHGESQLLTALPSNGKPSFVISL